MSRQNRVNPGRYTQRGRLTQDDAARELRKQSAIASPHTWQPMNTKARPPLAPIGDAARDTEGSAGNEKMRVTRNMTAAKAAPANARPKAAKAKTAGIRKSKRATGTAKTRKAMPTARKRTTMKATQKAVMARNAGGRAAPRRTAKRRKS